MRSELHTAILVMCIILPCIVVAIPAVALAQANPDQQRVLAKPENVYVWLLVRWSDNQTICQIYVDHAGTPTHNEVYSLCGNELYNQWINTPSCSPKSEAGREADSCEGLYLHFYARREASVEFSSSAKTCSRIWGASLPESLPTWLETPDEHGEMNSQTPYVYLAGQLIASRVVDANHCEWNGLLPNGAANSCGMEQARVEVDIWQNRFDARIMQVANESGVPGQLLKNIIAQESQFWPGNFQAAHEYGLAQLTEQGADTILLWNPSFFRQFCTLVLDDSVCGVGYPLLGEGEQALLRGALTAFAGAACPDCPDGFDAERADFSIYLLAQSLAANCEQVGQIIYNNILVNTGGYAPGEVSSYEDLWRFTLVNYNAGPGCLSDAITLSWIPGHQLTWDAVAKALPDGCSGAVQYVENITREQ